MKKIMSAVGKSIADSCLAIFNAYTSAPVRA